MSRYIRTFSETGLSDVAVVGGKNASLGEMYQKLASAGVRVPDGFATTANAFWHFLDANALRPKLSSLMAELDRKNFANLPDIGRQARAMLLDANMPEDLASLIVQAYRRLGNGSDISVAVRSSATAEDLPEASFAGLHESYLNVCGDDQIVQTVRKCYASLFTDRAIKYREDKGFDHNSIALSAGVQRMVRSDKACSGVCFTIEPESGFSNIIHISGVWGLGENIVQGTVSPDEFYVFKPSLEEGKKAIVQRKLGEKSLTMIYGDAEDTATINVPTDEERRSSFVLSEDEVTTVANWALLIEKHYGRAMDIEWAKDGTDGQLYIVQARPETVHSAAKGMKAKEYVLREKGKVLVSGQAIGSKIASGTVRILKSPAEAHKLQPGDVLVASLTSPDWDPLLKNVSAIVTDRGGRTSHASIIARELGVPAIVGTGNATEVLTDGKQVTISCAEGKTGHVYHGKLKWEERDTDFTNVAMPEHTRPMLIAANPDSAFALSFYPSAGVGLLRIEFIINHSVQVHPMALIEFDDLADEGVKAEIEQLTAGYTDKKSFFVNRLAEGVATIAAAFYPREVIVRMSDFKSNEYANLLGGKDFEPEEENPMLGFRGASRYYHPAYKEGFALECAAMKQVRDDMGLTNVKLMIPFCRTVEEGEKVIEVMREFGLVRGENGLEVYVMAEIPSNVIQAEEFAEIFDGFSIGSNDLTQLTLGIDRDSATVANLFSEQNKSAKEMIAMVIGKARKAGRKIGLCGQAPSDYPDFCNFLVDQGIDSISFNPDALMKGIENIRNAENSLKDSMNRN